MAEDAVRVVLIAESLNASRPARRTAAELLLQALRSEQDFGQDIWMSLREPADREVLAEIDALVHTLGIATPGIVSDWPSPR
jgi:hypothetical protein